MDIEKNIELYNTGFDKDPGRGPNLRYASFDYCYNYFQKFREQNRIGELSNDQNIQMSCLQLGYYLASWGMLRGSAFLLTSVSLPIYKDLIKLISQTPLEVWNIDVDEYTSQNIRHLIDLSRSIRMSLHYENSYASDTLVTKVILGVFGSVPAFDTNFKNGFGYCSINQRSLERIALFYQKNREIIDRIQIRTYDFINGKETNRLYPKGKIIDMVFFMEGSEK